MRLKRVDEFFTAHNNEIFLSSTLRPDDLRVNDDDGGWGENALCEEFSLGWNLATTHVASVA